MKSVEVDVRLLDLPEVESLLAATLALVRASRGLPVRWSDQCGECVWCRFDAALAAFDDTELWEKR
jgi:hypothetical protein